MPATDHQTLLKIEDNFITALIAAFNADTVLGNGTTTGPRKKEEVAKSRISAQAEGFAKASEQQIWAQGAWWDCHYAGPVTITIITLRGAPERAEHGTRVGRVRYLMSPAARLFTPSNLPHYDVLAIDQDATRTSFTQDTDTDRTELTFNVHLGLRPDAVPA